MEGKMESHSMQVAQHLLATVAFLFLFGSLAAKLADILKVPDVVLFLLIGLVIGPPGLSLVVVPVDSVLNQLVLIFGASFLLFHGGLNVSRAILKETWLTIMLMATLAVVMMVVIVGFAAHWLLGIGFYSALLLAAILAPTDPAALIPIFLSVRIRARVSETLISESAINDATGTILVFAILSLMGTGNISIGLLALKLVYMAGGGILIGLMFGVLSGFLVSKKSQAIMGDYGQVLLVPVITGAYLASEYVGASGFMAVFFVGLVYGNMESWGWYMEYEHHVELRGFIYNSALLLRMMIFILLGSHVDFTVMKQIVFPGLIIVGVFMLVARPLAVLASVLLDRRARWQKKEIFFMFWTRETGVIPATLSSMLFGLHVPQADVIAAITFLAILITLTVQASTTKWLAARLGLLEDASK